ncbi:MAG: hypothetical protein LBS59_03515 [Puniceicoccales bacterium]|jgi:hypothetical protein|nr:hypothetical protein [Puniceicoccales bacterium]
MKETLETRPSVSRFVPVIVATVLFAGLIVWQLQRNDGAGDTPVSAASSNASTSPSRPAAPPPFSSLPPPTAHHDHAGHDHAGHSHAPPPPVNNPAVTAAKPAAAPISIRVVADNITAQPAAELEAHHLRAEKRDLSESFLNIGERVKNGSTIETLEFPLFDGESVQLANFEYRPQGGPNEGVFFASIKGEANRDHVLFSYVNNALTGTIHIPSQNRYYDIRNATPQGGAKSQIILTQLDPAKMPRCGTCAPNSTQPVPPVLPR